MRPLNGVRVLLFIRLHPRHRMYVWECVQFGFAEMEPRRLDGGLGVPVSAFAPPGQGEALVSPKPQAVAERRAIDGTTDVSPWGSIGMTPDYASGEMITKKIEVLR